jgi:proteic killer suppression protein
VIRNFADRETERLARKGHSRRIPIDVQARAMRRIGQLAAAVSLDDLRSPPSSHLEQLRGGRVGQWSIRINDQWRLCFRFEDGDAFDVEIVDYH